MVKLLCLTCIYLLFTKIYNLSIWKESYVPTIQYGKKEKEKKTFPYVNIFYSNPFLLNLHSSLRLSLISPLKIFALSLKIILLTFRVNWKGIATTLRL
jgi:hypothetical protein